MILWGYLVFIAFPLVVFAAVAAFVLFSRGKSGRGIWAGLVGAPLGCAVLPLVLAGAVALFAALRPATSDYAQVFGSEPPPSITGLRGSSGGGPDWTYVFLAFDRTPASLAAVTVGKFETDPASAMVASIAGDGGAPDWFAPALDCPGRRERFLRGVRNWDDVAVIECPTLARVYVLARDIT